MTTYILRRLLLMIPTLLGITLVVFIVMAASPGGISAQSLIEGQNLDPEAKREIEAYYNRIYGLDDPPPVQYLRWLNNASPVGFTFDAENHIEGFSWNKGSDLGKSFRYGRPVMDLLLERIPITLLLNVLSIPMIYIVAISVGVYAATKRGETFDVASGMVMLGLWSIPTMLTGVLLIGFFANVQYWHWFPTAGLSSRQALDMPFLPHWEHISDVVVLFLSMIALSSLMILLSRHGSRTVRVMLMVSIGAGLGVLMVAALPESAKSALLYGLLPIISGGLFGLMAATDFQALRASLMGMTGMMIGIGVATQFFNEAWTRGFLLDRLWHLTLPIICLSYGSFAALSKLTRSSVLENLQADYARTARAKGVSEKEVLWRHVFRNSLLPLITVSSSLLPALLTGSVIVETIFSIEGMGKLAVESVQTRDRELVLSITLISGILTLLGYLVADLLYALADPRVSYE
jgi:peptide/nickel transport system permease protein